MPSLTIEDRRFITKAVDAAYLAEDEERALALSWREHGVIASRDRLFETHLRTVIPPARRYSRFGCSFLDLAGEGCLGLLRAIDGFDPERGFRLSTYARAEILQKIREYSFKNRSIVNFFESA